MFFYCILLAFCSSIDSLGIGISYGLKNIKISILSYFMLFIISLIISLFSVLFGNVLYKILPNNIENIISSIILIFMGVYIIYKSIGEYDADFNKSKDIDLKEAIFLGIAICIDTIGIGVSAGNSRLSMYLFPITASVLQILFLSTGILLGKKILKESKFSNKFWSILSGGLLIFMGVLNFFYF